MKNVLADGIVHQTADCVWYGIWYGMVYGGCKILVFLILLNFCKIFIFMFCQILLKFRNIQNNFVKISCFTNFYNAVSQPPYVGVEEEEEGGWGVGGPACTALAHPPRQCRLCLIRLSVILFSILSSLILWCAAILFL